MKPCCKNESPDRFYDISLESYKTKHVETFQSPRQEKPQSHVLRKLNTTPKGDFPRSRLDVQSFLSSNMTFLKRIGLRLMLFIPFRKCIVWSTFILVILTVTIVMLLYSYTSSTVSAFSRVATTQYSIFFEPNEPACKLPRLDPFHKTVMKVLKDLGPLKCEGEAHTQLHGGNLSIMNEGVTWEVRFKEIRRVTGDDDEIEYKDIEPTILEQQNETRSYIYEGFHGNIQHFNQRCFHPFGGERYPRDNTRVVLHSACRLNRIEFKLLTKDSGLAIQHVPSEKCLQPQTKNSTENIWKLVFSANCSSAFRLLENGRLQHIVSGFCINAINQTDTNRNEDDVVLKDDCVHKETGLYGLELKAFQTFTLKSEFVLVEIKKDGNIFKEFHLQALQKPDVLKRPIKAEGLGLNVFMFMLDSTSAAHFHRKMRRSLEYLQNQVNTIFFKGEGIVGDGTTAQLSAMLTGIAEEHQNEARRGKPGAKSVDDWNWIYKDFKNHGYATLLSEDDPDISTFNFRLLGYNEPPTDHYARPFWIALNKQNTGQDPSFCFGPQPIHNLSFSYVRSFCDAYPRQPKFSMVILSYLTHQYFNALSYADEDMVNLLQHLEKNGHMNNSLVIIFGDHGYRLSKFRETTQGKLEERLPFLSMTVPPWFPRKHPEVYGNLKHNSDVLTSPFDVYATLRHLLSYPLQPRDIVTGQSLFNRIDKKKRTCADAGIDTHWCPCMQWEKIDTDQELVPIIADSILTHINNLTSSSEQLRQLCRPLELKTIQAVWKEAPNKKVQRFKKTKKVRKCDSCVPVYGDKSYDTLTKDTMYQMQFVVEPGPAVFEASVRMIKGLPRVDSNYISRITRMVSSHTA